MLGSWSGGMTLPKPGHSVLELPGGLSFVCHLGGPFSVGKNQHLSLATQSPDSYPWGCALATHLPLCIWAKANLLLVFLAKFPSRKSVLTLPGGVRGKELTTEGSQTGPRSCGQSVA